MAAHGPILNRNGVKLGRVNVPFKPETFYLKHLCFIRLRVVPVSPFLAWVDFHARSRFARSTIPEEKWGTTRSLVFYTSLSIFTLLSWLKCSQNLRKQLYVAKL